jgi:hypothetical protein
MSANMLATLRRRPPNSNGFLIFRLFSSHGSRVKIMAPKASPIVTCGFRLLHAAWFLTER